MEFLETIGERSKLIGEVEVQTAIEVRILSTMGLPRSNDVLDAARME